MDAHKDAPKTEKQDKNQGKKPAQPKKKPYPHSGHRGRLRERYIRGGLKSLNDYEVLELLLTYVLPQHDVKPIAKDLLEKFHTLSGVLDAVPAELHEVHGIKERSAVFFHLIRDVSRATLLEKVQNIDSFSFRSSSQVGEYLIREIGHQDKECFFVFFLDNQNHLISCETMQEGTINQTTVYPREIFEKAIQQKATALLFAHNHPSGVLKPSPEDIKLHQQLTQGAQLLQISVLDHFIVSSEKYYSFHEAGIL